MNESLIFLIVIGAFVINVNGAKETVDNAGMKDRADAKHQEFNQNTEINDDFEITASDRKGEKIRADSILSGIETLKTVVLKKRFARQLKETSITSTNKNKQVFEDRKANDYSERLDDDSSMLDDSFEIDDNIKSRNEYNEERTDKHLEKDRSETEENQGLVNVDGRESFNSDDLVSSHGDNLRTVNDETKSDWDDLDDIPITRRMLSPPDKKVLVANPIIDEEIKDKNAPIEEITMPPQIGLNMHRRNKCCQNGRLPPLYPNNLQYNPLKIFPNMLPSPPRLFYPNIIQPNTPYFDHLRPLITRTNNFNPLMYSNYYQPPNQVFPAIPHYGKGNNFEIHLGYPYKSILSPSPPKYNLRGSDVILKLEKATEESEKIHQPVGYFTDFKESPKEIYKPHQLLNPKLNKFL